MGMNDSPDPSALHDDLAAYALNALDAGDGDALVAQLASDAEASGREQALRSAAGELAAAVVDEVPPPADLRSRVLDAARQRRGPAEVVAGASPIDVHRIELARAILLLRDLTADDWARPVDPPEFAGWTVHDVAVHVAANATLLADHLGVPVPGIPETVSDNEARTAETRVRHAGLSPAVAVAELEAAAEASDRAVVARGEDRLDEPIAWFGGRAATGLALLMRSFETWTHADDIRRAIGVPMMPPPAASLFTMTHTACGFLPSLLAARGSYHPDRMIRFRFVDLDTAWDVDLGVVGDIRPAGDDAVDTEVVTEALAFCRSVSARVPRGELPSKVTGDTGLADDVADALSALAVL